MNDHFTIFTIQFSFYGIFLGIAAAIVISYMLKRFQTVSFIDIISVLITTIIGARLLFIINNPDKILSFFQFNQGGLGLFGAIVGLIIGIMCVVNKRGLKLLVATDALFTILPIAQTVGRIGNFFNQELYGTPTSLPWGIYIDPSHRTPEYMQYTSFHPTFAYEGLLNILLFLLILFITKRIKTISRGTVTAIYLMGYGIIRILMNTLRIDKEYIFGIENSDLYSTIFIVIGMLILYINYRKTLLSRLKFMPQ